MANENKKPAVLSVKNLKISFKTDEGLVHAVRGVSFDLYKEETLCIVGESGSGKSVTSKTIMGILPASAVIEDGEVLYQGEDLTKIGESEFHRIRGHEIGMIFQDPLSSLNPIMKVGKQITEAMMVNKNQIKRRFNELTSKEEAAYRNCAVRKKAAIAKAKEAVVNSDLSFDDQIKALQMPIYDMKNENAAKQATANAALSKKRRTLADLKSVLVSNARKEAKDKGEKSDKIDVTLDPTYVKAQGEYNALLRQLTGEADKREIDLNALKDETGKKVKVLEDKKKEEHIRLSRLVAPVKLQAKAQYDHDYPIAKAALEMKKDEAREQIASWKAAIDKDHEKKAGALLKEKQEAEAKYSQMLANLEKQAFSSETLKEEALNRVKSEQQESLDRINLRIEEENMDYQANFTITKKFAKNYALKIMKEVGIPQPEQRYNQYPFEFSGGMRQRIVIAIALVSNPNVLICDEPTTALDVTIQAQILELINTLKRERHMSVIFITHDLGVVANMADRVAVMYAGRIVEVGTANEIFYDPRHPYTWALLSSIPDLDSSEKLDAIPGTPPYLLNPPKGDAFAPRNKYALAVDFKVQPPYFKITPTHYAATWLLDPRAPKVQKPKIVTERIKASLKKAGIDNVSELEGK
jgi:oligopeptide transport system ATP-binding protein